MDIDSRLTELIAHYLDRSELEWSKNTRTKRRYLLRDLDKRLGAFRLADLAEVLPAYVRARAADDLRPVSINNELRLLRRMLGFAVEEKIMSDAERPRVRFCRDPGPGRARYWTPAEVRRLLAACRTEAPGILGIVEFLASTGCRPGEALALEWAQVDLERRLVLIHPGATWAPKHGRSREVPIGAAILERLSVARVGLHVFPSREGKRYAGWPQNQFDRAQAVAGLEGGVYSLRHSYASEFLRRTADLPLLASIMGHSDTEITRLYAHLVPEHLASARDVVDYRRADVAPPTAKTKAEPEGVISLTSHRIRESVREILGLIRDSTSEKTQEQNQKTGTDGESGNFAAPQIIVDSGRSEGERLRGEDQNAQHVETSKAAPVRTTVQHPTDPGNPDRARPSAPRPGRSDPRRLFDRKAEAPDFLFSGGLTLNPLGTTLEAPPRGSARVGGVPLFNSPPEGEGRPTGAGRAVGRLFIDAAFVAAEFARIPQSFRAKDVSFPSWTSPVRPRFPALTDAAAGVPCCGHRGADHDAEGFCYACLTSCRGRR